MNEETLAALETLANKLGVTIEFVWSILVAQAEVSGIINIVWASVAALYIIAFVAFVIHLLGDEGANDEIAAPTFIFGGGFAIAAVFILAFNVTDAIIAFNNPQYWALKQILDLIP